MATQDNQNPKVSTAPPPIGDDMSSESMPYMILPDTDSSEMLLVIEDEKNTRTITPETTETTVQQNGNLTPQSQCCYLI